MYLKSGLKFLLGLAIVIGYLISIAPPALKPGLASDFCFSEATRFILSQQIFEEAELSFRTKTFAYPFGATQAFMPWGTEKDLLGAFLYKINPDIPSLYIYVCLSFLFSYLISGILIRKITGSNWSWVISGIFVIFNLSRHDKFWIHYELLSHHWIHFCVLLDVLIWKRFVESQKWDLKLEFWRAIGFLGMLGTAVYWWGPVALCFLFTRLWMLFLYLNKQRRYRFLAFRADRFLWGSASLAICWILIQFYWYWKLFQEIFKYPNLEQTTIATASFGLIFQPVWLWSLSYYFKFENIYFRHLPRFDESETMVTTGWFMVGLFVAAVILIRKNRAFLRVGPFVTLLVFGICFATLDVKFHFQDAARSLIPIMQMFRVASRWGLLFPTILFAILLLSWPFFKQWLEIKTSSRKKVILCFCLIGILELASLVKPIKYVPPLSSEAKTFFAEIKESPGEAVLDFPFCVVGGNGICLDKSCPFYPSSMVSQCLATVHGKNVFASYQARATESFCSKYAVEPYANWFQKWNQNKCFNDDDIKELCSYLKSHSEIGSLLIHSDVWTSFLQPDCQIQFEKALGAPLSSTVIHTDVSKESRVFRYQTVCK